MRTTRALEEKLSLHWEQRALLELRAGGYFSQLATELMTVGADREVLRLVSRAPYDEFRHAEICRDTAAIYGKREVAWPAPGPTPMASHDGVPLEFVPTLHVASMCCVNETIAGAWLEACYSMATVALAKKTLRALLREEIDHARIGWAHLSSAYVTPRMRRALGKWLPHLIEASLVAWLRPDRVVPAGGVHAHGVPSERTTREIVLAAVRDVVIPGFEHVHVDVKTAKHKMNMLA